ncbi:MAG TPA: hypothetical protein VNL69_05010 [Bacteroidota bacterium]|nr:hypothetical protein [Bacteroidota bacterium]
MRYIVRRLVDHQDLRWVFFWILGLTVVAVWDVLFLNRPALQRLTAASVNTALVGCCVVVFAFLLGWISALALHFFDHAQRRWIYLPTVFVLNLIRSVPQIVGVLLGYVVLTMWIRAEALRQESSQLVALAAIISIFVFLEVTDLMRERIRHFRRLDFFDAMLCSGIRESRIVNIEILWKNSRAHLLHKAVQMFAAAVFLLCSVDFIVSVGLSTDVSLSNFPPTLGGLLATMDSKQDILAVSAVLSDPARAPSLLFEHLQGVSTAFVIVFTLLCMHRIGAAFVARRKLE